MKVFNRVSELQDFLITQRKAGKSIGLVPTMGYLHEGHLSLIKKADKENEIVVVSIFVNPTQFGPNEDYEQYPRDLERDIQLSKEAGADIIFAPEVKEMYPKGYSTYIEVNGLTEKLCGANRPEHFRGVTTVVSKLFNIVMPDRAYFGQKDAQQCAVIIKMVKDFNFIVKIIVCPIVREEDGLALSSRNVYLNKEERSQALVIFQALKMAEQMIKNGEKNLSLIIENIEKKINEKELSKIEYIHIVDAEELKEIEVIRDKALIAVAVKFGTTRLIDNIVVEV